jgi:hypothetical protein
MADTEPLTPRRGTPWPNVLRDLVEKRDALTMMIDIVRTHFVRDDGVNEMPESPRRNGRGAGKERAARNGRTDGRSKGRASATRSLPEPDLGTHENGRREKIVSALMKGPLATREIAEIIRVDRKLTKMTLQRMAKVRLVKGVGHGPARRWALPGKSAKEEP